MAIWDFRPRSDLWTGSAIGVALLVVPVLIPVMAALARPVAKAVIKAGFMLYETGREAVAEISEVREDLAAAAKSGVQAELTASRENCPNDW